MMIGVRTAAWIPSGATLPYDAEVEWLESHGTEWIDTLIISQNDLVYDFHLIETANRSQVRFFGFCEDKKWIPGRINEINFGSVWLYVTFAASEYNVGKVYGQRNGLYHVDFTNGNAVFELNGVVLWTSNKSSTYDGSERVMIFDEGGSFRHAPGTGRISFFKVSKHSRILYDGIPVRFTNENGVSEGAMYDRVSGQLFRNQSTGAFIIGPDKA